jgi:hypothetical protein
MLFLLERLSRHAGRSCRGQETAFQLLGFQVHVRRLSVSLRRSLTRNRGQEMAKHKRFTGRMADSRLTVDAARCNPLAISRSDESKAIPREMFSRSASVSVSGERRRAAGAIPHAAPT